MDDSALRPPSPQQTPPAAGNHHGQQCPFVRLMTPEIVSQIEEVIAIARDAGHRDLSNRLDAWLVRITRVTATISEGRECGPELYIG